MTGLVANATAFESHMKIEDIQAAREKIRGAIRQTPVSKVLLPGSEKIEVHLKLENTHPTGAFKERGAFYKLSKLKKEQNVSKIVATSAGNHSQAVSYHGKKLGMDVFITMPKYTPVTKIAATQRWGADVRLEGESFAEALEAGLALSKELNASFVHAFDDPDIITGQGTVALEMLEQIEKLDLVLIPVGGGGLASGMAIAIKSQRPDCKVIGVQADNCDFVKCAVKKETTKKKIQQHYSTIADGIAIKTIGDHTVPLMQKYLDDIISVSDEDIAEAVMYLLETGKIVSEGAGAVGFAALMSSAVNAEDKNCAAVISGGNIDMNMISRIIQRGLVKKGRMAKLRVMISDRPGGLQALASQLAEAGASVLQIYHERASEEIPLFETSVELTLETRSEAHLDEVIAKLQANGFKTKLESFI